MKRITIGRRRRQSGPRDMARALIRELPNLFKLVYRLIRDPAMPRFEKVLFGAVALYMVTPIDLIPDFLGVVGWVDDFYLLGLALGRIVVAAGPDRLLSHWDGDPATLGRLVEGVEELGAGLPSRVKRGLRGVLKEPRRLRRRKRRPVQQIRVDQEDRVHLEE
jgi:uncharacterized membrane protein YkvA (DUF1232 family)